ncbi:MAG TPA: SDR family oxidoreductase, partial [Vicinamibacterales bacterium]|nr:SDR family oxidoreductase [Vicinamibacterales bacterium]
KAALITGGKRIGAVVAEALARRGMDVALAYNRSSAEAEATAAAIRAAGRRAAVLHADLSRAAECAALVDGAAAALGRLDVLVNMASVYRSTPFADVDEAQWDAALAVDLKAAFLCARAAAPHLRRAGGGRIINFSDWVAASGRPRYKGYLPYYVAKRAVIGLTEALALELADDQILVNAIAPGPILAPDNMTEEESASVETATPLGRWGGEQEIVSAVLFLVESGFVTGETIRVDGGRHVK